MILVVNEVLGIVEHSDLLDRLLSHAFGLQVTPAFNLLVIAFGVSLILLDIRATPGPRGRNYVMAAASEIVGLFKSHTTIEAEKLVERYLGQWMKLSGGG